MALQKKTPVVTIMGHVDHGKTSLLDYIRKTKVASKEFGQITQAIGAYQIDINKEKITFIDTPGHEAFSLMRKRGALVSNIVVLVISATDGVMPQTKECISLIKEKNIPFVVAINKIDLPEASLDKVKAELAENNVFVEGYGGNVVFVPISAKTGEGVDSLLEMILLTAELEDLKADPEADFEALVIESKLDKFCGNTASVIIINGKINSGDMVWCQGSLLKVKQIKNDLGEIIKQAFPGQPVLLMGFEQLPAVGSIISKENKPENITEKAGKEKIKEKEIEEVNIILKTDVQGSLEALLGCLPKGSRVVSASVGEIIETDILTAKSFSAEILAFNVFISGNVDKLAKTEKVKVSSFRVIYDLLKYLEEKIKMGKEPVKIILGTAKVMAVFEMKGEKIAGCKMLKGKINKQSLVLWQRGETVLGQAKVVSLKQQKQDINEAEEGLEFGIVLNQKFDFAPEDMISSFRLEEI